MAASFDERYEVVRTLGEGAAGEVVLAKVRGRDLQVAVKFFKAVDEVIPQARERFVQEAKLLAGLRCENVIRVLDAGAHPSRGLYFSMEFCEGSDLYEYIVEEGPLPPARALPLCAGLARGLAAVHSARVVHRDLKPGNVIITRDGVPKIADFGLAKGALASEVRTKTGVLLGTPGYMPPELFKGERSSAAGDIYSMGIVFYYLFRARTPWTRDDLGSLLREQSKGITDEALKGLAPPVAVLIRAMTDLDPAKRPDATQLVRAVGQLGLALSKGAGATRELARPPSELPGTQRGPRVEAATGARPVAGGSGLPLDATREGSAGADLAATREGSALGGAPGSSATREGPGPGAAGQAAPGSLPRSGREAGAPLAGTRVSGPAPLDPDAVGGPSGLTQAILGASDLASRTGGPAAGVKGRGRALLAVWVAVFGLVAVALWPRARPGSPGAAGATPPDEAARAARHEQLRTLAKVRVSPYFRGLAEGWAPVDIPGSLRAVHEGTSEEEWDQLGPRALAELERSERFRRVQPMLSSLDLSFWRQVLAEDRAEAYLALSGLAQLGRASRVQRFLAPGADPVLPEVAEALAPWVRVTTLGSDLRGDKVPGVQPVHRSLDVEAPPDPRGLVPGECLTLAMVPTAEMVRTDVAQFNLIKNWGDPRAEAELEAVQRGGVAILTGVLQLLGGVPEGKREWGDSCGWAYPREVVRLVDLPEPAPGGWLGVSLGLEQVAPGLDVSLTFRVPGVDAPLTVWADAYEGSTDHGVGSADKGRRESRTLTVTVALRSELFPVRPEALELRIDTPFPVPRDSKMVTDRWGSVVGVGTFTGPEPVPADAR